jgi:hypothetical protein
MCWRNIKIGIARVRVRVRIKDINFHKIKDLRSSELIALVCVIWRYLVPERKLVVVLDMVRDSLFQKLY